MYREQGSQSALSGVPSGPYGGRAKKIDPVRLAGGTLVKLANALNGVGEPRPIATSSARQLFAIVRPSAWWGFVLPIIVTTATFLRGLSGGSGQIDAWTRQPTWAFAFYAIAGVLFVTWVVALLRRRSHLDGLHPGTYLFPLDVVEIGPRDAAGRQLVTVRPLGGARDARVTSTDHSRRSRLRFFFQDATEVELPWPGDRDSALRHLALTQRLLEQLTFSNSIDAAFRNDLFFDLRVDDSWASVDPDAPEAAQPSPTRLVEPPRRRSMITSIVLHRLAPVYVVALGALLGVGPFVLRHRIGERQVFEAALAIDTPEAMDDYVAAGGKWAKEARAHKDAILERRARAKREREADDEREKAAARMGSEATTSARSTPEDCQKALTTARAEAHPEVTAMLQRILDNAEGHAAIVRIGFRRKTGDSPLNEPASYDLDRRLRAVEKTFVESFARVFSETCSTNVLTFVQSTPAKLDASTGLDVAYDLSWTGKKYAGSKPDELDVHAIQVVFDVMFHVPGEQLDTRPKTTFRLTMPPPDDRITTARPRSLFTIAPPDLGIQMGIDGKPEEIRIDRRVFDAMVARAFDRLYDEVYGLFFRGPPRVPLRDAVPDSGL